MENKIFSGRQLTIITVNQRLPSAIVIATTLENFLQYKLSHTMDIELAAKIVTVAGSVFALYKVIAELVISKKTASAKSSNSSRNLLLT